MFSHPPFKVPAGKRFIIAVVCSAVIWIGLLLPHLYRIDGRYEPGDLIPGVLIFLTSIPAIFPFYSIVSWGFRFAMLIRLDEQPHPISLDAWMKAYCNGRDMDVFYRDRMLNLHRFGMVVTEDDRVKLTPIIGKSFGKLAKLLYAILIPRKDNAS